MANRAAFARTCDVVVMKQTSKHAEMEKGKGKAKGSAFIDFSLFFIFFSNYSHGFSTAWDFFIRRRWWRVFSTRKKSQLIDEFNWRRISCVASHNYVEHSQKLFFIARSFRRIKFYLTERNCCTIQKKKQSRDILRFHQQCFWMTQFIIVLSTSTESAELSKKKTCSLAMIFLFISILCSLRISKILRRKTRSRRRMKKWPNTSVDSWECLDSTFTIWFSF